MQYDIKDTYTILKVYYRKENKYLDVLIDTEDLDKVKNKKIYIRLDNNIYRPTILNGKYKERLQSFLIPNIKRAYCKNKNYCDCRKENITPSPLEVNGLIERTSIKMKESSLKMSKEKRDNITRGSRENRYTKDYSIKLQEDKLGEKNISAVLTWDLVNEIRKISREKHISQYELADIFNVGRATIADIINYRTWTVNPMLNERVYKNDNIRIITNKEPYEDNFELAYDDMLLNNILLQFQDEFIYVEKLSIGGLIYLEQRNFEGKCLASVDVYIPYCKNKFMKKFYIIAKMNPRSKGRECFYKFIDKAFSQIKLLANTGEL